MGTTIIKPTPDDDFYVVWSSITDSPYMWGTRSETAEFLLETSHYKPEYATPENEERLVRADTTGTSNMMGWDGWDDDDKTMIFEQRGLLAREDLVAFLDTFDPVTERFDLSFLSPFEDEDA